MKNAINGSTVKQTSAQQILAAHKAKVNAAPKKTKIAEAIEQAEEQGIVIPTWKRTACAFFASIACSVGIALVISEVAEYTVLGILTSTSASLMFAFVIYMLAMIIAIYASMKVSQYIGNYVLSGQIDKDIVRAKNKVTGWFKREKKVTEQVTRRTAAASAAAFSG